MPRHSRLFNPIISRLVALAVAGIVLVTAASADGTPPLPPTSVTVTGSTASTISIAWTAPADTSVVRYRVLVDGAVERAVSSPQDTVTDLACGTTFTLGVASLAAGDTASTVVTVTGSTAPCPTATTSSGTVAPSNSSSKKKPKPPTTTTTTTTTSNTTTSAMTTSTATSTTKPPTTSTGITYYVSPTGSDLSSGTSASTPWRTITKANTTVKAGDTVVLNGSFSQQAIGPFRSGTASAPITYRSGPNGATLDLPGLVSATPYLAYFGGRSYVTVDGITFSNSNYVNAPVTNKGFVLRGSNHITITNCSFQHVQMQVYASDDNSITNNTFRYFVASYVNPATGKPDPNHPITAGDMLNIFGGSDRNLVQGNDMKYAGHSLIEVGSGSGASSVNSANVIRNNTLSNPWYKPLILSDDGGGTIVDGNTISDASTQPTLYSTVPSEGGAINSASAGVQFSGQNFILRNNVFINNSACYGVINLGSRWYFDSLHPNGVLVESLNNQIYNNTLYQNHAAASVSFVLFLSQSDVSAGLSTPRLTGNVVKNNIFWANSGTSSSWNHSTAYSTFLYHSATMALPWATTGYGGNQVSGNDFDSVTAANVNDVAYGTTFARIRQSLSTFQATSGVSSNLSVDPLLTYVNGALITSATSLSSIGAT